MRTAAVLVLALAAASCGDDARTADGTSVATSSVATTSVATTVLACPASVVAPGDEELRVTYGSRPGVLRRHVPSSYDGLTPAPLVLYLHGYGQSLDDADAVSGLAALGARVGFITVVPQIDHGTTPRWDDTIGSVDQAWFGSLLDDLTGSLCIDPARVYVAGLSNGAMMASSIACAFAGRVAAVAAIAGLRDPAGCAPSRPVPIIAVHGTDDANVSYDGGFGPGLAGKRLDDGVGSLSGILPADGPSVPEMAAAWATRNGCSADASVEDHLGPAVVALRYPCPAAGDVEILRYDGYPHVWATGEAEGGAAPAIELVWDFFAAHPLGVTS